MPGSAVALLIAGLLLAFLSWWLTEESEEPAPSDEGTAAAVAPSDDGDGGATAVDTMQPFRPTSDETPPEEKSVEEMSPPELEAACMAGRRAACDLLGH